MTARGSHTLADPPAPADSGPSSGPAASRVARAPHEGEYLEWLERVRCTYESVRFTCAHRLGDERQGACVAVQVTADLVARPGVFKYFGLPYSGRIATLAEARIAEAEEGTLAQVCSWSELRSRLVAVPPEHREVFVMAFVRGEETRRVATDLRCDQATARARIEATGQFMREVAGPGLAPGAKQEAGR